MALLSRCQLLHAAVFVACIWFMLDGCYAYQGFDCSQGSAILLLASHSHCGSSSQVACFQSLAMQVKACRVKAWPHHPRKNHRLCWGMQLLANVTNVNHAQGTLSVPVHGGGRHAAVPVSLEFSRPDESMYVRFGACSLRFDVFTASDASLQPVPGEESAGGVSALLALLLPAILVPLICVGLIVAVGSLHAQRVRASSIGSAAGSYSSGPGGLGPYSQLAAGPNSSSNLGYMMYEAAQAELAAQQLGGGRGGSGPSSSAGLGLFSRTFNLKAMSRRAHARRMRRAMRPVYMGMPAEAPVHQQMYAAGLLQPGGGAGGSQLSLVAPCFRFPPVAVAPGLPAIPEATTPSSGNSAAPSRCSSCPDMLEANSTTAAAAAAESGPAGAAVLAVGAEGGDPVAAAAAAAAGVVDGSGALLAADSEAHVSCQHVTAAAAAAGISLPSKAQQHEGAAGSNDCTPPGYEEDKGMPLAAQRVHLSKWLLGARQLVPGYAAQEQSV